MSPLTLVVVLILVQTALIGVLLWRFRRFEHAATSLAKQYLALQGRLHVLEERVATYGRQ